MLQAQLNLLRVEQESLLLLGPEGVDKKQAKGVASKRTVRNVPGIVTLGPLSATESRGS